ncbi:malto-oligosyltrehalose trehalohydrolase [Citricoccus sp. GCM10030269]|uniref:malto-oligosyltrehalose trehalohydrolase n=1 Tax=Citricoccus sp. GCM10030269 TaxID=3273388 RepID=UPI00360E5E6C
MTPQLDPSAGDGTARSVARDLPLSVWAPSAQSVELAVTSSEPGARHDAEDPWSGADTFPLEQHDGGWWAPPAEVLSRLPSPFGYGYVLDGEGPFPDPRSRWQPDTVHGPSRRIDLAAYDWQDHDWSGRELRGAAIYELHVGTFTEEGTLEAAARKLDHLVALGVTHVELLPMNSFGGARNWGYDGVGWYAVDESYGGPRAYQRFVDACHGAGLAVIQDVVYNHLGPSGNYLPKFGPYLTEQSTGWGSGLNLDGPESDEVRRYILDNVRLWFRDYHVDGLRLDAVHALHDTRAVHVLEEMSAETDDLSTQLGRPLVLIAESDRNDPRMITARDEGGAGGYGLTGQWSDDFHHAVHVALTGETDGYYADFESLSALAKVLNHGFFHDGTYSSFRQRHHGRPLGEHTPAEALVVCTQNHDQVGNRAAGDRLTATLDEGQLAIGAALLLAGPFTPMLFMGEEWAASTPWQFFTAHREPELAEAVTEGRRREFERMAWNHDEVPDPQAPETRQNSVLRWDEAASGRHARVLALYRALTRLRAERPELTDPDRTTTRAWTDDGRGYLRLDRGVSTDGSRGTVVLLAALGDEPMPIPALRGYRLLAGHGPEGPIESLPDDGLVPAHAFVLLGTV